MPFVLQLNSAQVNRVLDRFFKVWYFWSHELRTVIVSSDFYVNWCSLDYSWFQCCVYTLIFRPDSTVMIRLSRFDREVTKQYSILPWISYRNQTTQSESYFNDSLNVSLVIQKKRTVIHNLFSFSDNSLLYKSRNLIAIHVIGLVNVSINKFFGSFPNFFQGFYLDLQRNIIVYPIQ